jgi:hypothetical protein
LSEIGRVGEKLGEIDHVLIEKHSSDAASKGATVSSIDDRVDMISDELLSLLNTGDSTKVSNVKKWESKALEDWLRSLLNLVLLLVLAGNSWSVAVLTTSLTTEATSATTATSGAATLLEVSMATSWLVLLVSTLVTTLVMLLSVWAVLMMRRLEVTKLVLAESINYLLSLVLFFPLLFLFFLFL